MRKVQQLDILGADRLEILGRRSDRLDALSRGPDKQDRGSDLDYNSDNKSDQPASNIEIDISSMESNSEVSNRSKIRDYRICLRMLTARVARIGIYNCRIDTLVATESSQASNLTSSSLFLHQSAGDSTIGCDNVRFAHCGSPLPRPDMSHQSNITTGAEHLPVITATQSSSLSSRPPYSILDVPHSESRQSSRL